MHRDHRVVCEQTNATSEKEGGIESTEESAMAIRSKAFSENLRMEREGEMFIKGAILGVAAVVGTGFIVQGLVSLEETFPPENVQATPIGDAEGQDLSKIALPDLSQERWQSLHRSLPSTIDQLKGVIALLSGEEGDPAAAVSATKPVLCELMWTMNRQADDADDHERYCRDISASIATLLYDRDFEDGTSFESLDLQLQLGRIVTRMEKLKYNIDAGTKSSISVNHDR